VGQDWSLRSAIAHDRSPGLRDATDEALVDQFRQGDREALSHLVRRHQKPLYNFALRQVRNESAAEDVVQETFRRVVQSVDVFGRTGPFSAWMYKIARNLCIDTLRLRAAKSHRSLDEPEPASGEATLLERTADPGASVERAVVSAEIRVRALSALDSLPEEQREVFLLREMCDLRFAEIAEVVSASENTVKSRMRYALERLQAALCDYEEYARELR